MYMAQENVYNPQLIDILIKSTKQKELKTNKQDTLTVNSKKYIILTQYNNLNSREKFEPGQDLNHGPPDSA